MLTNVQRLTKTDLELASTLRISVTRLARRLRNQRSDLSLSISHLAVLGTLERHGARTPRELADHEHVQPPSMTRTLAALEARGLVRREPHPTDGRQTLITITEAASRMIREDRRRKEAWLARRLAEFTPEQRQALHEAAPVLDLLADL